MCIRDSVGSTVLTGTDRFDQGDEVMMRDYLKSRIFMLNKLRVFLTALNVMSVAVYLLLARCVMADTIRIITSVSIINFAYSIIGAVINLKLMNKMTNFRLNLGCLKPYLVASAVMAMIIYTLRNMLGPLPVEVLKAAPLIIALVIIGALIYGGTLYLISREFREFLKEVRSFINSYKSADFL